MHVIPVVVCGYDINLLGEDTKALKMNTEREVRPEVNAEKTRQTSCSDFVTRMQDKIII